MSISHPKRRFALIFHTSGVSRRLCELTKVLNNVAYSQVDDFNKASSNQAHSGTIRMHKKILKGLLSFLGVIVTADTNDLLPKRMVSLMEIRGHYSKIVINSQILVSMKKRAHQSGIGFFESSKVDNAAMHIRLGDLVGLEGKTHTDFQRINQAVRNLELSHSPQKIVIFSDSPQMVLEKIEGINPGSLEINHHQDSAWDEMSQMINSRYFVGTASKLSTWVCCLRIWEDPASINYMPLEMAEILRIQLAELDLYGAINYY
jgi:hypothetical protein